MKLNIMDCSDQSFDDNIDLQTLILQKEEQLLSITRSLADHTELDRRIENLKLAVGFLPVCEISTVEEELFKHVMPVIIQTFKHVYDENCKMTDKSNGNVVPHLKHNLQMAFALVEGTSQIFKYLLEQPTVQLPQVQSIPLNGALALIITFEHCKISQKQYHTYFESVTEVLELFRKAQSLHLQFLHFVDSRLSFDAECKKDLIVLKQLLELMYKTSEVLSGINIKSVADNWKTFITLIQKYSNVLSSTSFDILPPIKSLTAEVDSNLQKVITLGPADFKASSHLLKVAGFLAKVVLKLFQTYWSDLGPYYEDVVQFCVIVYSVPCDYFQSVGFKSDFLSSVETTLFQNIDPFIAQLLHKERFLEVLTSHDENHDLIQNNTFGYLNFLNKVIHIFPTIVDEIDDQRHKFQIEAVITTIFCCIKKCFKELCFCSSLYDDLTVNVAVLTLMYPQDFNDIELLLLKNVIQGEIWVAMIAMDVWYFILRNTPASTCYETLNALLTKIEGLRLGVFTQTPETIYLKVFARRVFDMLPPNYKNTVISKYNLLDNYTIWKFLGLSSYPLAQRHRIETLLSELFDKASLIDDDDQNINIDDFIFVCEALEIISTVDFDATQLNNSRLIALVNRLWSINVNNVLCVNHFFQYFIFQLTKLTKIVIAQCNGENLLLILNQLKSLLPHSTFKLQVCDVLKPLACKEIGNCQERMSVLSVLADIFQILFESNNPVVIRTTLEVLMQFSNNVNYNLLVKKVTESSRKTRELVAGYKNVTDSKRDMTALGLLQNAIFQHKCFELRGDDLFPLPKKLKLENDVDEVINDLKSNVSRLEVILKENRLSSKQTTQLKRVINQLDSFI